MLQAQNGNAYMYRIMQGVHKKAHKKLTRTVEAVKWLFKCDSFIEPLLNLY